MRTTGYIDGGSASVKRLDSVLARADERVARTSAYIELLEASFSRDIVRIKRSIDIVQDSLECLRGRRRNNSESDSGPV